MRAKIVLVALVLLSLGWMLAPSAFPQSYPARPIEVLVPYTAGSSVDLMGRVVADIAPKYVGQPLVVVNKVGAGGSVAAADVIGSRPDGYKLVIQGNMFFATTTKSQKIPFDPNDLEPLYNFMEWRLGMAVRQNCPWKGLKELLDYARKNPGEVRFGHSGRGIPPHMAALLIFKQAGVQVNEITYKGSPEVATALLGGHLDVISVPVGTIQELVAGRKLRVITVYADRGYKDLPDAPAVVELGFPDAAKLLTYAGFYIHKNTPESIKAYLIEAFKKTSADPKVAEGIVKLGEFPRFGGPEFLREKIRQGEEVGVPILKELGLYVGK